MARLSMLYNMLLSKAEGGCSSSSTLPRRMQLTMRHRECTFGMRSFFFVFVFRVPVSTGISIIAAPLRRQNSGQGLVHDFPETTEPSVGLQAEIGLVWSESQALGSLARTRLK